MDELLKYYHIVLIVIGSVVGSLKASMMYDKDKGTVSKVVNICVGVFGGCNVAAHFASELSVWLASLLSLLAGASSALVVEVLMQSTPQIVKLVVEKYTQRYKQ